MKRGPEYAGKIKMKKHELESQASGTGMNRTKIASRYHVSKHVVVMLVSYWSELTLLSLIRITSNDFGLVD